MLLPSDHWLWRSILEVRAQTRHWLRDPKNYSAATALGSASVTISIMIVFSSKSLGV